MLSMLIRFSHAALFAQPSKYTISYKNKSLSCESHIAHIFDEKAFCSSRFVI